MAIVIKGVQLDNVSDIHSLFSKLIPQSDSERVMARLALIILGEDLIMEIETALDEEGVIRQHG